MFTQYLFLMFFQDFLENGDIIPVINNFECARACIAEEGCSSYFYKETSRSCRLSDGRYLSPSGLNAHTGYGYYILRPECQSPWEYVGGQCYLFQNPGAAHTQAQLNCVNLGGYLATTDSVADDAIIKSYVARYGGFWVGGTDVGHQGQWVWLENGEPITLSFWATDQPDNGAQQDCLEQWGYLPGWNDGLCGYPLNYLCEK